MLWLSLDFFEVEVGFGVVTTDPVKTPGQRVPVPIEAVELRVDCGLGLGENAREFGRAIEHTRTWQALLDGSNHAGSAVAGGANKSVNEAAEPVARYSGTGKGCDMAIALAGVGGFG